MATRARYPASIAAVPAIALLSSAPAAAQEPIATLSVRQEPGGIVYWVLPGPRRLDPAVFGTPGGPRMLLEPRLESAEQGPYPPSVPQLLKDLPFLVGVPLEARSTNDDGEWVFPQPNPFSNNARIVSGSLRAEFRDYVIEDRAGAGPATRPTRLR